MTAHKQSTVNTWLIAAVGLIGSYNGIMLTFALNKIDAMNTRGIQSEQKLVDHDHHLERVDAQLVDLQHYRATPMSGNAVLATKP